MTQLRNGILFTTTLLLGGTACAAGNDNSWYLGAKAGWSHFYDIDTQRLVEQLQDGLQQRDDNKNAFGLGVFAGYQLNRNVGVELGYDWLGKYETRGELAGIKLEGEAKSQMLQASLKLGGPISEQLDLYTRLGGAYAWTESSATARYAGNTLSDSGKEHSAAFVGALGAEYSLTPSWALRLEYQYTTPLGDASLDRTAIELDNGLLALGIVYRVGQETFTQAEPITPPPVAIAPARVIINQRFNLSSDVLFEFNRATLKPAAHLELDKLYRQLKDNRTLDGRITIVGHTDRIGSDAYNQPLSELRARSVADYLQAKGISASKLSSEGRGKREPLTGERCHQVKRSELIPCLAPDRRVEIMVEGISRSE
ncbi:porin OmpA [Aeromonas simiae]|uniref:porin OmpA n=1 Tax=Aeromonas simiae TaxID=218936 RepID=UPI00266B7868|nr:porin OmpA [Aeromonas simiae]MDO2950268.1 porin OmpA [Aeromonas simiae]MDO2953921.1 porin OmpA [Aeromonas simiae]MDO2957703.1 porin OmpA [Aeromonas simiae]